MTEVENKAAYEVYAEIGRFLTQFNMLEMNMRLAFERAADSKFGPVLGIVQNVSTRLAMVIAALKAVEADQPWAARIIEMEKGIRTLIAFRNELSHGMLGHADDQAVLIVRAWDTGKSTRVVNLTVDDLRAKNLELDGILIRMLLTTMPVQLVPPEFKQ